MMRACLLASALVLALPAGAQPDLAQRIGVTAADAGAGGYHFETVRLSSTHGRQYRLRIAVPSQPPPPAGYPVAWLLDGNAALMDMQAATFERLAQRTSAPVLVFISHDNDLRIDGDARAYDYTPRRPGGDEAQLDPLGSRRNGGAQAFLDWIIDQAKPRVAAQVPIDPARQALWGHSYGGVFVLYTLFTRPQAFSDYGAVDPSLWWGNGHLLQEEAQVTTWPPSPPRLRLWLGEGESQARVPAAPNPRDAATVEAMRRARQSVPADAAVQMAARLRTHGMTVNVWSLPGVSHGQTLGASLPLFLEGLPDGTP